MPYSLSTSFLTSIDVVEYTANLTIPISSYITSTDLTKTSDEIVNQVSKLLYVHLLAQLYTLKCLFTATI